MRRLLVEDGWTLQEIGNEYGITRERVRQILHERYGITSEHGDFARRARRRRDRAAALAARAPQVLDTYRRELTFTRTAKALHMDSSVVSEIVHTHMDENERKAIDSRWRMARRTTNEHLVRDLITVATWLGKVPGDTLTISEYEQHRQFYMAEVQTLRNRLGELGGWPEVVAAAGYRSKSNSPGVRRDRYWTRERVLESLVTVTRALGHFPSVIEYDRYRANLSNGLELPSGGTIRVRVGTWRDVERALHQRGEPA